jgi:hypothetical protein
MTLVIINILIQLIMQVVQNPETSYFKLLLIFPSDNTNSNCAPFTTTLLI